MRPITFVGTAVILFATGIGVATAAAPFRVTATHGSGSLSREEGDVGAFEISILPNGKTSISTLTWRHNHLKKATRNVVLTAKQLENIARSVTNNRFWRLPSAMDGGADDSPAYTLEVVLNDRYKKVRVHAPAFYSDKSLLRRFRLVWAAVLQAVSFTEDPEALRHLKANS